MRDLTIEELNEYNLKGRWKRVEGFEEYYLISETGEAYSIRSAKKLKPTKHNNGYLSFGFCLNGKAKKEHAHRLVAQAFIPNPEGKPQVNHIDGCKTNNHVSNLEWNTSSENNQHAFDNGLRKVTRGSKTPRSKLTEKDVLEILELLSRGELSKDIAPKFNVSVSAIGYIKNGITWSHITGITPKTKRVS